MRLPASSDSEGMEINLTPVIDVVFLLLIFFLVATQFGKEEREMDVNLPEVTAAQPLALSQDLVINITSKGKYVILGKEYNETQIASVLKQRKANNPQPSVQIRGDGDSAWRHGVRIMGLCNAAGIKDYRVAALEEQ